MPGNRRLPTADFTVLATGDPRNGVVIRTRSGWKFIDGYSSRMVALTDERVQAFVDMYHYAPVYFGMQRRAEPEGDLGPQTTAAMAPGDPEASTYSNLADAPDPWEPLVVPPAPQGNHARNTEMYQQWIARIGAAARPGVSNYTVTFT